MISKILITTTYIHTEYNMPRNSKMSTMVRCISQGSPKRQKQ